MLFLIMDECRAVVQFNYVLMLTILLRCSLANHINYVDYLVKVLANHIHYVEYPHKIIR